MNKYFQLIILFFIVSCSTDEDGIQEKIASPSVSIIEEVDVTINQASFKIKVENFSSNEFETGICWSSLPNPVKENAQKYKPRYINLKV